MNTYKTAPLKQDTDGDGVSDGQEVKVKHTDPLVGLPPHLAMTSLINIHPVTPGPVTSGGYPDQQVIDIAGLVSMPEYEAQDAVAKGYTVALRYWGDDPNSDDLLTGPVNARTVFSGADGLHFQHYVTLPHFLLDEDSGTLENAHDRGIDEIYVGARLIDDKGKNIALVESNRVTGDF